MNLNPVDLTKSLVAIPSPSDKSNIAIADFLQQVLKDAGFTVERLAYRDENNEEKVSLVARKGEGKGGFGLTSHSDTVPGGEGWDAFNPVVENNLLIGRGTCDMKGPMAATIVAAASFQASELRRPLYLIITSDEEIGYAGAREVVANSQLLKENWPENIVVAEPTRLRPVHAHKGGVRVFVTAYGRAAHTSTGKGISSNFLIAPFIGEMAELVPIFKTDERFLNHDFDPPHNAFNMVIDDGGTKSNVTAAKTVVTVGFRPMPNDRSDLALEMILERARKYNLEATHRRIDPFYISPDAPVVRAACEVTGLAAEVVPFGTEAAVFGHYAQAVVLGPGDVAQAHTIGEFIDIDQLESAVEIYRKLIRRYCM